MRTIALEEHFWTPELAAPPGTGPLAMWGQRVDDQLRDLGESRLANMDASGIDIQVISHVAPAAQGLGGTEGIARARAANDRLAGAVRAHPDRLAGFAQFGDNAAGRAMLDALPLAPADKARIAGRNAEYLLRLKAPPPPLGRSPHQCDMGVVRCTPM